MAGKLISKIYAGNTLYTGSGKITESVTQLGVPVKRKVRLHVQFTGAVVKTAWSDLSGSVTFSNLDMTIPFLLVAMDYNNNYDVAAIGDRYATFDGSRP